KERGLRLIIKGDTWDLGNKEFSAKMTCKIDPTKKPKTADMTDMTSEKQKSDEAIYELDGDRLKLCSSGHRDRPRPKKFETEAGTPQTLLIFERAKPAEPNDKSQEKKTDKEIAKLLVGSWLVNRDAGGGARITGTMDYKEDGTFHSEVIV